MIHLKFRKPNICYEEMWDGFDPSGYGSGYSKVKNKNKKNNYYSIENSIESSIKDTMKDAIISHVKKEVNKGFKKEEESLDNLINIMKGSMSKHNYYSSSYDDRDSFDKTFENFEKSFEDFDESFNESIHEDYYSNKQKNYTEKESEKRKKSAPIQQTSFNEILKRKEQRKIEEKIKKAEIEETQRALKFELQIKTLESINISYHMTLLQTLLKRQNS